MYALSPYLLKRILATSILAVGVATSPGYSIRSLPTVNLVLLFSFLSGCTLQMNCPYVMYFLLLFGVSFFLMNVILLVEFFICPSTPFARRPNLFADELLQFSCILGFSLGVCN